MTRLCIVALSITLSACVGPLFKPDEVLRQASEDVRRAGEPRGADSAAVQQALMPPLVVEMPRADRVLEPTFDLVVNAAPAAQVFNAMVSGTRYSVLVHPEVKDTLSVHLKSVTVPEALAAIREIYGYDYRIDGNRIFIHPRGLQTRVFQVNYLLGRREGRADVRVTSGSIQSPSFTAPGLPGATTAPATPTQSSPGTSTGAAVESSRVTTSSVNDYWRDLEASLKAIVGGAEGRGVVVNAQSGVVVVRAFPDEIRHVDQFLRAMQGVVARQVMLEAKIIEVQLADGFQTGINWAAFRTGANHRLSVGTAQPGTVLSPRSPPGVVTGATGVTVDTTTGVVTATAPQVGALPGSNLVNFPTGPAGLFGLAFQNANFAALLNFLETQGSVHVLSSPRIATLNNQKAVLKVGNDDFFVTNVSTTTSSTGTTSTVSPTITVQPFFSGIALDVTPQIAEDNQIILHVHPSVSVVTDRTKTLNLGALGTFTLPLASSNVNESDTIVRVTDGSIVAIGGLMRQSQSDDRAQMPGLGDVPGLGALFRNTRRTLNKTELVILLKTTVIQGDQTWQAQARELGERMQGMQRPPSPAAR